MFEGSIVKSKSISAAIDWNTFDGGFSGAKPTPFLEIVDILKTDYTQLQQLSVVGKVYKRWPFYYDITGNYGTSNGKCRLRFLMEDTLSTTPVCFYVTCFGKYAEELEKSNIAENDEVQIWKPCISPKRWQPKEKQYSANLGLSNICDFEIWFGIDDSEINVNYEKRIIIYKQVGDMTELQNISSRPPIVQNLDNQNLAVQASPKKPKVLSNENIDQATFPEIAIARQKSVNKKDVVDEYENYVYSEIKECNSIEKSTKYNLYAVVTNVKREPLPTRGSKMMSQVYITDISCEGTYGRSDYQFSLLGHRLADFPKITAGSIIRIHHMSVQMYNGYPNGRVFDARSVTVIGNVEKIPLENQSDLSNLNKRDLLKLKLLQDWWTKEGKEKQSQSQELEDTENQLRFCDIVSTTKQFNIMCTVREQITTKVTDKRCKILRVFDGTNSSLPMMFFDKDANSLQTSTERDSYDIFVMENLDLMRLAKAGKHIHLKGVQFTETSINENSGTAYKLLINSDVNANCRVISSSVYDNRNNKDNGLMEDSEFDRMFANAIQLPDTEESSADFTLLAISNAINKQGTHSSQNGDPKKSTPKKKNNLNESNSTVETDDVSRPIFPCTEGSLIIRSDTSTDDSTADDVDISVPKWKNNETNKGEDICKTKDEQSNSSIGAKSIAISEGHLQKLDSNVNSKTQDNNLEPSKKACATKITTDISFGALFELEKNACGTTDLCSAVPPSNQAVSITNLPDSMEAIAGSQLVADLECNVHTDNHDDSDVIPGSMCSLNSTTKTTFAIRSTSNFPLISSLADVANKKTSDRFRLMGYVREVRPNILRCHDNLQLLHTICDRCCTSTPLLRLEEFKQDIRKNIKTPACKKCNQQLSMFINIELAISDTKRDHPIQISNSEDSVQIFKLAGTHAEYLLGTSANNFLLSIDVQTQVIERLTNIIGERVELSALVIDDPPKREYQIINSYIPDEDEEHAA